MDVSKGKAVGDVEDRRDEFNQWQQLLMGMGVPPVSHLPPGFAPGEFDTYEYLDANPPPKNPSAMAQELGYDAIPSKLSTLTDYFNPKPLSRK